MNFFQELQKKKIDISETLFDHLLTLSNASIRQAIIEHSALILNRKKGQPLQKHRGIYPHPVSIVQTPSSSGL